MLYEPVDARGEDRTAGRRVRNAMAKVFIVVWSETDLYRNEGEGTA